MSSVQCDVIMWQYVVICMVCRVWCVLSSTKCTGEGTGTGAVTGADAVCSVQEYVKAQYSKFC